MSLTHAPADWYLDFFCGLVADFWKTALPAEVTAAEAAFLERHLRLVPGARVLDVPCGHGRLALALAARGCRVTGVDISDELLAAARADASTRGLADSVSWIRRDMRELPDAPAFDAAFCCGSSFGFLGDSEDARFLSAVSRALEPGGRFVLDASKAAECLFPAFVARRAIEKDGLLFEAENRYDPRSGRVENRYTLSRGGERECKLASHRIYTASQVCGMLEEAGFEILGLFGSSAGAPFALASPQLFVVGERRRGRP